MADGMAHACVGRRGWSEITAVLMQGNLTCHETAPLTTLKTGSADPWRFTEMDLDEHDVVGPEHFCGV